MKKMTRLQNVIFRRIGIEVVIMKKTVQTRSNRDENSSVQGEWFE